ncbi:hypothetical protein JHK85_005482 [Glycine max]|nr:hypothetical protein JHK85_005482 [Glycine max]
MGCCLSARIKAESPPRNGLSSKDGNKEEDGLSSKASTPSVPPTPRTEGEILKSSNMKSFNFSELKTATRNFRPDSVVGEGGFGCVFKGWIDEQTLAPVRPGTGMVIAVKRLNQEGLQGHSEWLLRHPNLVKLIGYCLEDDHRLLVYEFLTKGSLDNHLFRRASYFQPLSWNIRMKVALDAAKGLAYLHSDEAKVIYRDFKASNILLDSVSHLTKKSDVYSFGVVLLEIMSGKRALDSNRPSGEHNLIEWAKPYLSSKRRIFQVMDARIEGQYMLREAMKVATLAIQCLSVEPRFRPKMDEVVRALEELQDSDDRVGGVGSSRDQTTRRSGPRQHRGRQHETTRK